MRDSVDTLRAMIIPMAVGAIALAGVSVSIPSIVQAADVMKIEVTIKDDGFTVTGHTTPGTLTEIVLHNNGTMTHGFSSRLMKDVAVSKQGDAVEVRKHGVRSFHIDAGKTASLIFAKPSKSDPATGMRDTEQYPFWCDIHPNMRGEFLIVETRGDIGGG